jgi:2-phospho-L-lactate guanylyltransferase
VNTLDAAKSRLRAALSDDDRRALVLWLAGRVVDALATSSAIERVAVVSPDRDVLAHFAEWRAVVDLQAPGGGLNADLESGRRWALQQGADALLVALADVPLLTAEVIRRVVQRLSTLPGDGVVLAPDRAGLGTNLLMMRPADAMPFRFGTESLARHMALARRRDLRLDVHREDTAAFDVDTPADLDELAVRELWRPTGCISELAAHSHAGGERDGDR